MTAYYNEINPYAAAWLRNLIAAGHIAAGDVDERSIEDVSPDDLRPYAQCHFFAGIGVWSHALRGAGWPDDREVWTGSCPCQPFSAAGQGGGFADERHLWPAFHHLIEQRRPRVVFGEQVASKDGLQWLDLVLADLEGSRYAAAALDMCAASFGAPHIRQRLWWVADDGRQQRSGGPAIGDAARGWNEKPATVAGLCGARGVDDDDDARSQGHRQGSAAEGRRDGALRSIAEAGELGRVGYAVDESRERRTGSIFTAQARLDRSGFAVDGDITVGPEYAGQGVGARQPGPTNGFWRDADWLGCRDGKWRPVEPGTFPLAHGAPARVGRLRAYGNAIVGPVAQAFIEAFDGL